MVQNHKFNHLPAVQLHFDSEFLDFCQAAGEIETHMLAEIDSWGGTTNHLRVWLQYGCDAWRADTFGSLHQALERATERVHGTLPVIEFDCSAAYACHGF